MALEKFIRTPNGDRHIFAKHSGKCLDVSGSTATDTAPLWQYALHGGDNQKWELQPAPKGGYHIIAKHRRKALDVLGWSLEDCGKIVQYTLHGGANPCWRIER